MIGFWRNRLYQLPCCSFFHHKRSTAPSQKCAYLNSIAIQSEFLLTGFYRPDGAVLIVIPEQAVENGAKLG